MPSVEERLTALEQKLARLEETSAAGSPAPSPEESFWILRGLQAQAPGGAVAFAGHLGAPAGPVEWQWGRPTDELLDQDWESSVTPLEALGHPVRLRLLQRVLNGVHTTAELSETEDLGTTGQLHHHLRILLSAGWLESPSRGRYRIPPQRVVPLLVIIAATV